VLCELSNPLWPAGLDWTFWDEEAADDLSVRFISLLISIGGMLITALLLGIVSGVWKSELRYKTHFALGLATVLAGALVHAPETHTLPVLFFGRCSWTEGG
jgi:hypothetical protein